MSLRHKLKTVWLILLVFLLVGPSVPSAHGDPDPSGLNVSLTVFEDTGTAGDRSDDTKISFSGFYTAVYSWSLTSSRTRLATRFTKLGEINKVRVCWEQGTTPPTGTAYIRIETDAAGPYPSGTLADADAEISVSASTLPTSAPEWLEYTFPGAVTLSESNWYWIVLKYEPGGSETINVMGSVVGGDLPSNINLGGYYTDKWYTSTSWAYVAFVVPETTHSLPLYRRTNLDNDLPVAAGLNQIADLPNDVNKVYRIVMQIQPKGDDWRWAPDDGAATDYYIRDAGSTPSASDIWDSDNAARPQFILQSSAGNGAKDDVFISGDEASEWDGTSSITLTECGDLNDASDPDAAGEQGIYPYDGTQWWDAINDAIALDNWQVVEFWFKLDDDWSNGDIAELRYWQEAEGGHTDLAGLRYRLHVGLHHVDTYYSDYINPKDTYSLTETVYAKATGIENQIGWLSGWGNRVRLTIDHNDINSDLSDFPVLVHLSTSSGRGPDDVSFVFDELQGDANRKKIAVTKDDGTTQCYVEIEHWDDASEEAWLWVKVSGTGSVSSTTDTVLYLYYDADHADNTAYVGDPNSTPAENVWDSDFELVCHMRDDPDTSNVRDSTSNNNDGGKVGAAEPAVTTSGMIDDAQDFDGSNDYINHGQGSSLDVAKVTLEVWVKADSPFQADWRAILTKDETGSGADSYSFRKSSSHYFYFTVYIGSTEEYVRDTAWTAGVWNYYAGVYNGSDQTLYKDGSSVDTKELTGDIDSNPTTDVTVADYSNNPSGYEFAGIIDEVRISSVGRSEAWIKASNSSGTDHLIDFGTEETHWLSGWGNRVRLTIDHNDVDSDLSDFPVLVHLSTSSGRGPDDVSFVFDELQGDANRKKIAVTKDDGTTQCYVEIEHWDDASEEASLWVKAPSVNSSTDTDLFLYYDADHADNTAYVGDSGSRTEVWDSNFIGVWHLCESSSTRYDSTSNDNDLTPSGTVTSSSSGRIGSAISLTPSPEGSLYITDNAALSITENLTISAWTNLTSLPSTEGDQMAIASKWVTDDQSYYLFLDDVNVIDATRMKLSNTGSNDIDAEGGTTLSTSTWYYVTVVYDSTDFRLYLNDFVDTSGDNPQSHTAGIYDGTADFHIGRRSDLGDEMNGLIDEVRVSNTDRSAAWVKSSYESGRDHLIDFGSEESRLCDFRYYSDWTGTPTEEGSQLNVAEDAAGGWRSTYLLGGGDPTGTWGVRVYEAGTSILMCSCSFTVQSVPEFPYGVVVALVIGFAFFLVKRKTVMKRREEL